MTFSRFNSITKASSPEKLKGINIIAPCSGKVFFAQDFGLKALGEGVVIHTTSHQIISPINATVIEITPSHGRVVLQAKNGLRMLIQLPLSYTEHMGLGIGCKVSEQQQITAGQTLLTLDLYKIQQYMKPVAIEFLIINSEPFGRIQVPHKIIEMNEDIVMSLIPFPNKKAQK